MDDERRFQLLEGPYSAPNVEIGQTLPCEIRGDVRVYSWSQGRIPWPLTKNPAGGGFAFIIFGDLARAIRTESNQAVAYWFGACVASVSNWRRALNVKRYNGGTKKLKGAWMPEMVPLELTARNRERGRQSVINRKGHAAPYNGGGFTRRQWTAAETALLGTMSDRDVAHRIGCAQETVGAYRRELGISAFNQKIWQQRIKSHIVLDPTKLQARRLELDASQETIGARAGIPAYYAKLEGGVHCHVRRRTLERLAATLECQPEDLVAEDGKEVAVDSGDMDGSESQVKAP